MSHIGVPLKSDIISGEAESYIGVKAAELEMGDQHGRKRGRTGREESALGGRGNTRRAGGRTGREGVELDGGGIRTGWEGVELGGGGNTRRAGGRNGREEKNWKGGELGGRG